MSISWCEEVLSPDYEVEEPKNCFGPGPSWNVCLMCSRLVTDGLVPYVKAYEELPVEMRLEGKDGLLFRVEVSSWS